MKKVERLRERTLFRRIAHEGRRTDAQFLRCTFLVCEEGEGSVRVAFKVPSRKLNAVRRNRIRRLMREAFSREQSRLTHGGNKKLVLLVTFRGAGAVSSERLKLADVRPAMSDLLGKINRHLEEGSWRAH